MQNMRLGKEKARPEQQSRHASWLRLYAIKLEPGCYVITGGAIKLTRTMEEREHTLKELSKTVYCLLNVYLQFQQKSFPFQTSAITS